MTNRTSTDRPLNCRQAGPAAPADRRAPWIASGLLAMTTVLATSSLAQAIPVCKSRDHVFLQLENRHDEQVLGRGLAPNGQLMYELMVSSEGSWTLLASDPDGKTCIIAIGENWQTSTLPIGART